MAAGVPTIRTAILKVIEDERNGLLLAPGDQAALAKHILALLGDPELRDELGEAAGDFIEEQNNLARQKGWLSEIYTRVSDSRGCRRG